MSLYFIIYIIIIFSLIFLGSSVYKKYRKFLYGKYLLSSLFLFAIWLLIYLLAFTTTYDKDILLVLSRILYSLSLIAMYIMLAFSLFYPIKIISKKIKYVNISFLSLSIFIFLMTMFSPYFIPNMLYDPVTKIYYEEFGKGFIIYKILYLINPILFIVFSFIKSKKLSFINKVRFKFISLGFSIFITLYIFVLAFLPILGIRILQKEQVLFFIPFILSIMYVSHRYNFINIKLFLGKIFIFLISIFLAISSVFLLINLFFYYISKLDNGVLYFWQQGNIITKEDLIIYFILLITFFSILYKLLYNYFISKTDINNLSKNLGALKKKISYITNLEALNSFLKLSFSNLFKINYVNISLFEDKYIELKKYFEKDIKYNLFINDIVFIEENKYKFDFININKEICKKSYLIFPLINNRGDFLGIFEIGVKAFKDPYYSNEIEVFKDFVEFLILHLKHIEIYSEIQDININLDRKIDEKTIEYNNLLNKQTDFISMISHEIKSPLGSCIFQVDSIIDDIKSGNQDKRYLLEELEILNTQLLNVGNLTKTIFSIKKFDLNKIELSKQKVDINVFLSEKVQNYKKEYKNIQFILDIDENLDYITIDKIQFGQVIDNLLVNAIKFSNKEKAKIYIKMKQDKNNCIFEIEDNGKGFDGVDAENIFDKYTTGKISNVGIGMGMYLCKKIVELHGGNIIAENGVYLSGASFKIVLPISID